MKEIELLAPAGSMEAAIAAVRSGANAIYMGFGDFNARRNAKNFSTAEMAEVCSFCRGRGVKTNITLNTLLNDREFSTLDKTLETLCRIAPDAIIVADLGVARAIKEAAPDLCLHASTQLTVHNIEGAKAAKELGFSRVVLSRELDARAISEITNAVDIETEVFVHGALCMCYSGQCYMSGFIGRRSGNRGLCAQPCRLPYRINDSKKETYPLSLRDLCLARDLSAIRDMGVSSLKIEGRMKRPEYVAVVCDIYSRLLRENRLPTNEEATTLRTIFSRGGFTDGYFKGKKGPSMFGTRESEPRADDAIYKDAQKLYSGETPRVAIDFNCTLKCGDATSLTASDSCGNSYTAVGPIAEPAINRPLTDEVVADKLSKTGGTPFFADNIVVSTDNASCVPVSAINSLRRECLDSLLSMRSAAPKIEKRPMGSLPGCEKITTKPALEISIRDLSQLSDELLSLPIERIYIPIESYDGAKLPVSIGIKMPQIMWDKEWPNFKEKLGLAKERGISHAIVSNISQIAPLNEMGFTVHGDMGLNILNSRTLSEYEKLGVSQAILSPELMLSQIRDIEKYIPCGIIAYGRLPLMITENCTVSSNGKCPGYGIHTLTDRRGATLPVLCLPNHRNMILNSDVLYLADKQQDLYSIGLSHLHLLFTIENAKQVADVTKQYLTPQDKPPAKFTRGLYYRGVE